MTKKKFVHFWDIIIWILICVSGWFLYYSNTQRVAAGYFESGQWVTWTEFGYAVFFALLVGYAIAKLIEKTKR